MEEENKGSTTEPTPTTTLPHRSRSRSCPAGPPRVPNRRFLAQLKDHARDGLFARLAQELASAE